MPVSSDKYYKPEETQGLKNREMFLGLTIDIHVLFEILIDKKIIDEEELEDYRNKISNYPKYKAITEDIQNKKAIFKTLMDDPNEYLKIILGCSDLIK